MKTLRVNKLKGAVLLALSLSLVACGNSEDKEVSGNQSPVSAQMELPENAPEIGTKIEEIKAAVDAKQASDVNSEFRELSWDELSPAGYEQDKILDKYQDLIEQTPEGSPEENEIFDKMMSELNSAPANQSLDGQKIKLPGFVSPLEEKDGKITEFLLVPYFGACIHVPPPPLNNTLLIKPQPDHAIPFSRYGEPVWVLGQMQVETSSTDLAEAGYLIDNAQIEVYDIDVEAAKKDEQASTDE